MNLVNHFRASEDISQSKHNFQDVTDITSRMLPIVLTSGVGEE